MYPAYVPSLTARHTQCMYSISSLNARHTSVLNIFAHCMALQCTLHIFAHSITGVLCIYSLTAWHTSVYCISSLIARHTRVLHIFAYLKAHHFTAYIFHSSGHTIELHIFAHCQANCCAACQADALHSSPLYSRSHIAANHCTI